MKIIYHDCEYKGKRLLKGYIYKGYEIYNLGYYLPDRCIWWGAVNIETGCADHHAHTKHEIKKLIDLNENLWK